MKLILVGKPFEMLEEMSKRPSIVILILRFHLNKCDDSIGYISWTGGGRIGQGLAEWLP
jgi:hypothetical protein